MGPQELDIVSVVAPLTKYAKTIIDPNDIRYELEKRWHLADAGRRGPVWLDIPLTSSPRWSTKAALRGFRLSRGSGPTEASQSRLPERLTC